jgi:hypothetical protein
MKYHTGHGGYQYTWLSLEGVKNNEVWSKENGEDKVIQPTNLHKKLKDMFQAYNFYVVSERIDESMVALSFLMGLHYSLFLVSSAKLSGSYDLVARGRRKGRCVVRNKFYIPNEVREHIHSPKYLALSYADQIIYRAANASLDMTIKETIGEEKFHETLQQYRELKERTADYCGSRLLPGCWPNNGTKIEPHEPCYIADFGCGYKCYDEVANYETSTS